MFKENFSIFPNMQKNLEFYTESNVILPWTDCNHNWQVMGVQLLDIRLWRQCVSSVFSGHGLSRQLTGDQKKSWVCHELFKRNNLGKVKITDLGTVRSLMLAVGNWLSAQEKQSGKNQNKAHPLLTSKQCVHCV